MDTDVLIIGSGQAGVPLAVRLANAGKRVVLVERAQPGGTCINYGCTPTKTMIASARAAHVARNAGRLGVRTGPVTVDLAAIVARKNRIVSEWREGVLRRLRSAPIEVLEGSARFVGDREIEVQGKRHRAEVVVLNVGARPAKPPSLRLESIPTLDNRSLMELTQVPRHLLVLGGGYIGCEFGQMFRRFGAEVTIIDRNAHLMSREDPDFSTALEEVMKNEGVRLSLGAEVLGVERRGDETVVRTKDAELRGTHLLVALGRTPNTDDLGCDAGGIRLDARGFVVTDDSYQSSAPGVFAVGDATGGPQFTHTAWDDHRILFDILMGKGRLTKRDRLIPYTVFTDPPLAHVGLSERQARAQNLTVESATMPFGDIARAIETDERAGLMKVLIDAASEKLLGATILGAQAGELIHIFAPLIREGATARGIVESEFVHPTFAEGVQTLVMRLPRYALK